VAQAADIDQYMPLVHGLRLHGTSLLLMDGTDDGHRTVTWTL